MRRSVFALLVAASAAAAPVESYFGLTAPKGWRSRRMPHEAVLLTGPEGDGVASTILVRWIDEKNEIYGTPDAYAARLSRKSAVPLQGWTAPVRKESRVAGRRAVVLTRDIVEYADAESIAPRPVPSREEHVAVEGKGGFYLLVLMAPRSVGAQAGKAFRALVEKGFTPKR